jgi:hypothetical protein
MFAGDHDTQKRTGELRRGSADALVDILSPNTVFHSMLGISSSKRDSSESACLHVTLRR